MRVNQLVVRGLVVALILVALPALATPVGGYKLSDLVTQQISFTNGDKRFSNFQASITVFGGGTAVPTDLSGITVTPIKLGSLFGVQLSGGMAASCGSFASCPTTWDLNVSWDVTAAAPYLIDEVYLSFNGTANNFPYSVAQVTETIAYGVDIVGSGSVLNYPPGPLSTTIPLNGSFSTIRVTKDILLVANIVSDSEGEVGTLNGANLQNFAFALATISDIDQYYHQVIPEPGTYAMIGLGLAALGLLRRRTQRNS